MHHKLRKPTQKQIEFAIELGIKISNKSFRVLSAEIADAIELKSFKEIERREIKEGDIVKYIGNGHNLFQKRLEVSSISPLGFIYFRKPIITVGRGISKKQNK